MKSSSDSGGGTGYGRPGVSRRPKAGPPAIKPVSASASAESVGRFLCPIVALVGLVLLGFAASPSFAVDTVTNTVDGGVGSLREVVSHPGASSINFAVTGKITLTSGAITIGHTLTIGGPGATNLAVSGNNSSPIFRIPPGVTVVISNVTIMEGRNAGSDGLNRSGSCNGIFQNWTDATDGGLAEGGAIINSGVLRLYFCMVASNAVSGGKGGSGDGTIPSGTSCCGNPLGCLSTGNPGNGGDCHGGAIYSDGTLVLLGCTFANNSATAGNGGRTTGSHPGGNGGSAYGGAVYNAGQFSAANCTFGGNSAAGGQPGGSYSGYANGGDGIGGAIENAGSATSVVSSCTISGNSTAGGNVGLCTCDGKGHGGGMDNENSAFNAVQIVTTIVSGNSGESGYPPTDSLLYPDVAGFYDSLGFNLIDRTDGSSGWISSDLTGSNSQRKDPLLGPSQMNGGPTPTRLPQTNSPAINKGMNVGQTTDQRGLPRTVNLAGYVNQPGGDYTDIGAVELQSPPPTALDIGLRVFDGTSVLQIACTNASAATPFRIAKNGTIYGVVLTSTNATDASKIRIKTSSGVKAWAKLP